MMPRLIASSIVSFMTLAAWGVSAQDYPSKPIRLITGPAGGGSDATARLIGQAISGPLGQQVVIDNRPTVLAAESLIKSPPDGYTLQIQGGSLWISPLLQKVSYEVTRDFAPVSLVVRDILVIGVHPSLPVKSIKELIALAKARPGELNYGSGTVGGSPYLAAELFKQMAGVNITHIPYKGGSASVAAVISGETQIIFSAASSVTPYAKSGRLRPLAVTSATPSTLVPGLPTVAASGLPGYAMEDRTAMFAPAKTPAPIITRVNQEVVRALNTPDLKEKFLSSGVEAVGSSPEELAAAINYDITTLGKLIKDIGLKTN